MTKRIVVLTSLVFACFASLGLFAETVETNDAENVFCDLMMQTTNSWGRDVEVFRAAANAGMRTLSNIPGKAGEPHRLLWLTTVVRLQSPTNTCDEYLTWQDEKGKWLFGLGHKYRSSSCSNLWLAVADELRCQRIAIPTEESIRNRYRDAVDERYYVWEDYSDYIHGVKVPGDLKAFGVCDEEWQKTVRNCARGYLGDTSYGYELTVGAFGGFSEVGGDSWKCNVFVAHRLAECQLPVPAVHHGRFGSKNWPPLANEWGNPSFEIEHWSVIEPSAFPQPGMVAVKPSAGPNGHVGIMDFDGMAISAQRDSVTRASNVATWGNAVYRRYAND